MNFKHNTCEHYLELYKADTQETGGQFPQGRELFDVFGCFGDRQHVLVGVRVCVCGTIA